jgi:hypothetical protein
MSAIKGRDPEGKSNKLIKAPVAFDDGRKGKARQYRAEGNP